MLVALVATALGILLGLLTPWHTQSLSASAARKIVIEHQPARFEIIEYSNGSKELWMTPPKSRHYPRFIAPADGPMLALLAENKIAFHTSIQGVDFGYDVPRRGMALLYISILATGAVVILWRAWRKEPRFPASVSSSL